MKSALKGKSALCTLFIATGLSLASLSCKKDSNTDTAATSVTETDAAEVAINAIVPANGGMVEQTSNSVNIYQQATLSCGIIKDSTLSKSSPSGSTPSYSYSLSWNYTLSCSGQEPSQLAINFSGSSNYNGARMSSSDNSTGIFVMTGLQSSSTAYQLNTNYVRNGSQTSKIGRTNGFTSVLTITSSNITIDKASLKILSGTATVSITGASTSGKSFSYNGSVTFLGSNQATLVLNSGSSYAINW